MIGGLVLLLWLQACLGATLFEPGSPTKEVVVLKQDNFKTAIDDAANPFWLLKFYAPW